MLIDYDLTTPAIVTPDGQVLAWDEDQRWALARRAHASALMQRAVAHRSELRDIGRSMGPRIWRDYGLDRVCGRLIEVLERLEEESAARN